MSATTTATTPQPTTNLNAQSTNYQFICLADCSNKIGVTLTSINIDKNAQTMVWNFNILNNGTCSNIRGGLSLESLQGDKNQANGGTFTEDINFNSGQQLPRSATFSALPKQGTPYTVSLSMYCDSNGNDYQPVLFSY
ncbi:hypothetical protein [Dictyobacter kobayashii]|uniref:Uncharacterized protein n=1 Tax=Dictyobacter kobayashii TaxID=2014872 RepID=A0A402AQP2_9CHLR|nr:hypothetical protein [Dictyobacter kobayashii]GCE21390.1 hypothetical protein KDK_51900 [Dictyobacter kobayashii]